jgi:hypothetical protein
LPIRLPARRYADPDGNGHQRQREADPGRPG